ncbi:MAG: hypothetical protein J6J27_05595 [Alphaproteobacteria bacterium]|nr:hypothetical protein [Alphaproteobacteria bacterium]
MVEITLKCVFCKNNLTYNTENKPKEGDMIKCHNCGKMNDFDAAVKVAIDNNKEKINKETLDIVHATNSLVYITQNIPMYVAYEQLKEKAFDEFQKLLLGSSTGGINAI